MESVESLRATFVALSEAERQQVVKLFTDWQAESQAEGFEAVGAFAGEMLSLLAELAG